MERDSGGCLCPAEQPERYLVPATIGLLASRCLGLVGIRWRRASDDGFAGCLPDLPDLFTVFEPELAVLVPQQHRMPFNVVNLSLREDIFYWVEPGSGSELPWLY